MRKRKVVPERAKENANAMTVAIVEMCVVIIVRVDVAMIGAVDVVMIGAADDEMIGAVDDEMIGAVDVEMIGAVDVEMIGAVDVEMIGAVGEVAKVAALITATGRAPGGAMMSEAGDLATGRKFRRRKDSLPK